MIYTLQNIIDFNEDRARKHSVHSKLPINRNFKYKFKLACFKLMGRHNKHIDLFKLKDYANVKRILIMRYDVIGDYIVSSSLIRYLKEVLPNAKIDIIVSEKNAILAKNDPNINEVHQIKYDKSYNFNYFKLRYLRKNNYDIVFALIDSKVTKSAFATFFAAPKAVKVSSYNVHNNEIYSSFFNIVTDDKEQIKSWTKKMFNYGAMIFPKHPNINYFEQIARPYILLNQKAIDNINTICEENNISYKPPKDNILTKDGDLAQLKEHTGREYILLNIAGSKVSRLLTKERVKSIINHIAEKHPNYLIFLTGGPAYKELASQIEQEVNKENVKVLNTDLLSFMGLVLGAKLVISPDTSVTHIASIGQVNQVVMYVSEGALNDWFPYNSPFIALLSPNKEDVNAIPINEILDSVDIFLNAQPSDNIVQIPKPTE